MYEFESISGSKEPVCFLAGLLKKRTIPHALLFTGTKGAEKKRIAAAFAAGCNCNKKTLSNRSEEDSAQPAISDPEPCGVCRQCRKIGSGSHPDIINIEPKGASIKIEQIRALSRTLSLKPYEARVRVIIISDANTMNQASSNALLKALEEPAKSTIFILTATRASEMLPTIVSRCQEFRFQQIGLQELKVKIMRDYGLNEEESKILAFISGGSYDIVQEFVSGNFMAYRKWLIRTVNSLSGIGECLGLAEKIYKKKKELSQILEIIVSYLRDLAVCKFRPDRIINTDMASLIYENSKTINTASIISKINAIQDVQKHIEKNIVSRVDLESMIMKIAAKKDEI